MFPAVGEIAPPESPVSVTTPPVAPEPNAIHVAVVVVLLDSIQAVLLELFTQVCPMRYLMSVVAGDRAGLGTTGGGITLTIGVPCAPYEVAA